jgi:hypothetical protein
VGVIEGRWALSAAGTGATSIKATVDPF